MELKNILEEILNLKLRVEADVLKNPSTIQGHMSRKRAAELKLPEVKREYKTALLKHIVPVVVAGSSAEEFSNVATEQLGVLTVDGEGIFKDLVSRMPDESMTGKMSTKVVMDILSRHFSDVATESDVLEYPQVLYKNSKGFAINNKLDLDRLVKMTINESVGSEMATIYNLKSIAEKALEMNFDGEKSYLPVLMTVNDESIVDIIMEGQKRLLLSPHLLISGEISDKVKTKALAAVEKANKENVSNALKTVKNTLKKRSK